MTFVLSAAFTAFIVCLFAMPSLIKIASVKNLYDEPESRKNHGKPIPNLGGIGIYAGITLAVSFWSTQKDIVALQYIQMALTILFFIGVKDDIFNLVPWKKLVGEIIVAFILVHFAKVRINTFYGLFGIFELGLIEAYLLSIFSVVVITNSFNLIDGIDGLAASLGFFSATCFGLWFYLVDSHQYAILAFSLAGALVGFFVFNKFPAKIFMGDTGSLLVGFVISLLAIEFIEMNRVLPINAEYKILSVPVVAIGILFMPFADTLRVFFIRAGQGRSPFNPDRNHFHHAFLEITQSHWKTCGILVVLNILVASGTFYLQALRGELLLTILIIFTLIFNMIVNRLLLNFRAHR